MQKSMETEDKGTEKNESRQIQSGQEAAKEIITKKTAAQTAAAILWALMLVLLPGFLMAGCGYYYSIPVQELLRNLVMLEAGICNLAFAWFFCEQNGTLDYDNSCHRGRFLLFFTAGMLLCCLLPYFPHQAWPLLPFAVALSLAGNVFLGLFAYGILVMSAVFVAGSSVTVFFLYFICGGAAALLFMRPEAARRTGIPMLTTLLYFFAAQTVSAAFFDSGGLSGETFVLPGINLFVTALLLFLVVRSFRTSFGKQAGNEQIIQCDEAGQQAEEAQVEEQAEEPRNDPAVWIEEMERRQQMICLEEEDETPGDGGEEQADIVSGGAQKAARYAATVRELTITDGRDGERNLRMSFYVENDTEVEFPFSVEEIVEVITKEILTSEACPYETHVNVLLTDNEGIRQYNRDYREIDRPTDVLSFPNLDFETPGDFSEAQKHKALYFDMDTGKLMLGDIIISVDKVKEQAQAFGHSEKREFAFLVAHSMLHLCGYDHMEKEEAAVMKQKQITALIKIGITRDYR